MTDDTTTVHDDAPAAQVEREAASDWHRHFAGRPGAVYDEHGFELGPGDV